MPERAHTVVKPYTVVVSFAKPDNIDDETINVFYEVGFGEGTFATRGGVLYWTADMEARSSVQAALITAFLIEQAAWEISPLEVSKIEVFTETKEGVLPCS